MTVATKYPMVKLRDVVVETQYGTSKRASAEKAEFPILRMNNLSYSGALDLRDLKWIDLDKKEIDRFTVKRGDLLFNRTNSRELVGKTAVWNLDDRYAFAGYLIRVRFDKAKALPEYVSAYLNSGYGKSLLFARAKPSCNMSNINATEVLRLEIPLPPLAEQKRIAAILNQADAIRRKRRQAIETTGDLSPSFFRELFGSGHDESRYKIAELGSHAEVVSGVTKGRRFNGQPTLMLPYLRVANVQDGRLDLSEIKKVEALPRDLEKLRLEPGDVLLTEGGDHDKLGRGALWEGQVENCIHQNHIFRVRVDRRRLTPVFFAQYLQTAFAKAYFLRCAKKTTNLATINMRQLRALPIPLPSIKEQECFVAEVHATSCLTTSLERSLEESDSLFASLVQRAFRGEL